MANKKLKVGNVPNLRFPGFNDEWKVKKLGEVVDKVNSGKTPLGGEAVYTKEGVLFIRSQNVNNDKLELENSVFIPELINEQMKNSIVQPNDILLNITGASLGRSCVVPNDFKSGNVNQHVCIIRLNKKYNPMFLQPLFSSCKGQTIFTSLQTGSGREGLNFESIKSIKFFAPIAGEQLTIASFLSLINERITTQNKIIRELDVLKSIFSQIIFSKELKFQDNNGNDFPAWETKKLKEVCNINPKTENIPNSFYYIDLESVVNGRLLKENRVLKDEAPGRAQRVLAKNDILFQMVRPYQKNNFFFNKEGEYVASTGYAQIRTNQNPQFIFQYLHNQRFVDKVIERCTGTSYPAISSTDLGNIVIDFPSLAEQMKVADLLSSVDKKIDIETKSLQKFEEQKKYLLQNLFI